MAVTVTSRVERAVVLVDVSRVGDGGAEQLEYSVASETGEANFIITDAGATPQNRFLSSNFPEAAPGVWKRLWPLPHDPIAVDTEHNLVLQFARTPKYTYKVTLVRANGTRVPIMDIDYEADDDADFFLQPLMVALL